VLRQLTHKCIAHRREVGSACAAIALFLTFGGAPAAQTDNLTGVIGLLTLPQLAGRAYCEQPARREAPLYAVPDAADVVGWIRSDRDPASDADCYQVVLNVYDRDGSVRELPINEYEEEEPGAAVVVETRGRWFKLRLTDGAAWFHASSEDRYLSLEELLGRRPAYLTEAWDRTLAATAGGVRRPVPVDPRRRVIGYVEPVLQPLRVVLAPGQDPEEIRRRYNVTYMPSEPGPNGTRVLSFERGVPVRAFERPDRAAPAIASFQTDACHRVLRAASANPPEVAVFERRAGWLQVALLGQQWKTEPRAWIEDTDAWRFHALGTDSARKEFENKVFERDDPSVRVVGSRVVAGALWLQIEMMSHTIYESDEPPTVIATGWVPAHGPAAAPAVWFYSRD
jgi:hypothetical protein